MSMFIIGRHTRAEEESGRDELVRAAAIGRQAPMTAAVVDAMLANVALGALRRPQPGDVPARGARTRSPSASGLTLTGWVFTGTALIAAQLTASTRSMYGIAGAVIGVAYVLARRRRRGGERAELALADRVVPGHARVLRPPLVAGPAPASPEPRSPPATAYAVFAAARHRLRRAGRPAGPGPRGTRAARPVRPGVAPPARRR